MKNIQGAATTVGRIPVLLGLPVALGCLLGFLSPNPLLTCTALLLLVFFYVHFWRQGEPPVLFYALFYQWLQGSILIFLADLEGVPFAELDLSNVQLQGSEPNLSLEPAAWLTLAGLLALAIGMRLGSGARTQAKALTNATAMGAQLSIERLFIASIAALVLAQIVVGFSYAAGPLRQPLLSLANLHWVVVYMFTYAVMFQQRGYGMLSLLILVEIAIGSLGFFSDFKTVLVIAFIASLAVPKALKGRKLLIVATIAGLTLVLAVVWTAVKKDYRMFSNAGSGEQVSVVTTGQQVDELARLVGALQVEDIADATARFLDRLSYVYLFGEVMRHVPDYLPYENGALWGDAIYRLVVPRLLDPDKAVTDDSGRTAEYTGLRIIGGDFGTSVSLGFMAESYIDFGPWLMFAPLLLWGWFVGWAYRKLITSTPYPILGYGAAVVTVYLNASVLESSNAKIVAGFGLGFAVLYLVQRHFGRRIIDALSVPAKLRATATRAGSALPPQDRPRIGRDR